jgi:hypothetical protein
MPLRNLLIAGLCLGLALAARADVRHDLEDPALAATVNGEPLSNAFVDAMLRIASTGDPSITRAAVINALIDDRLIAAHTRATEPDEEHIENNKVGFSPAMQIEQAVVSNLQAGFRKQLEAQVKREKGGSLNGLIVAERAPTPAQWKAVVGSGEGLQLEYALNEKQRAAAAAVVLLKYRLGGKPGQISLLDVYEAQNVQGRNQLHARSGEFALGQARELLKNRYIMHWARSPAGLGEADFKVLRRAMEDRLVHSEFMAHMGVAADIHDDPQHLKDLQANVTREEIHAYYDAHRDEFSRIEKVKARHIRVAEEKVAQEIGERLKKGEKFADLAKQFSMAADAASGGDLGWIEHGSKGNGWLESLAFLQKPGLPSRPVRMPGGPGENPAWEILLVEERVTGWQDRDGETVRYLAGQAIAKQKALKEYRGLLEKLRRDAVIRQPAELSPLARPAGAKR